MYGLGLETARSLAKHGCEVIFACRDLVKADEAIQSIKNEKPAAIIDVIHVDFCSLKSVKNCANEIKIKYKALDIVIFNAGVFGIPFSLTEDNYETTFQVNHLAQFYLLLLLKPVLLTNSSCRVIIVASESHRFSTMTKENISEAYMSPPTSKNFTSFMAYNDSKLCNVITAAEIHRRWNSHGITCNSVHPGNLVSTGLSRNWWLYKALFSAVRPFTKSLQQAASTSIWGATAHELNGVGGQYFNNCWLCVPVKKAEDPDLAKIVWDLSVAMIERHVGPIPTLTPSSSIDVQEQFPGTSNTIM